jgi:hypothetical protein
MASFSDYREILTEIAATCDVMSSIWSEATIQSELERIEGRNIQNGDLVDQLLAEVRGRLSSSMVEVGVFGSIKRGKSTLINALIGLEVSSMDVLPETAIPVWIKSGSPSSDVMMATGEVKRMTLDDAKKYSSQKHKAMSVEDQPIRVEHSLPISWLPEGIRLIDTPGLDDPDLSADYEELTLAELDRVAAVIYVMSSPPGIAEEELSILRSMAQRSVDKLFLVCNFYSDQWAQREVVTSVVNDIATTVRLAAGDAVGSDTVVVYPVSALKGLQASLAQDPVTFKESGIERLRQDLETYLLRDAADRLSAFVSIRLDQMAAVIRDTLNERRKILQNPSIAGDIERRLEAELRNSKALLGEMKGVSQSVAAEIAAELSKVLSGPYDILRPELEQARTVNDAEETLKRLRLMLESAASRASTVFSQRAGLEQLRMQRRLYESFGIDERLEFSGPRPEFSMLNADLPEVRMPKTDMTSVAAGAIAGAATLGSIGGTLAYGAGTALLWFMGPVGWIAGLGLGLLFGAGGGAILTKIGTKGRLDDETRHAMSREWDQHKRGLPEKCRQAVGEWVTSVDSELEETRSRYFHGRQRELSAVQDAIRDGRSRDLHLERIETLLRRLDEVH